MSSAALNPAPLEAGSIELAQPPKPSSAGLTRGSGDGRVTPGHDDQENRFNRVETCSSAAEFAALTGVSRETLRRLDAYAGLLRQWSGRINLVAASTLGDLWRRHFLDSAQLFPLVPPGAQSLIDLGSGAGFPGLVLAIMGVPGVELVESDARKCAFLREAARLAAAPVAVRNARIETVPSHLVDVVTARGCAPLDRLLVLAQPFIGPDTVCLFPKGEQARQELTVAQQTWEFDATSHQSRSDPRGVVLCLSRVARRDRKPAGPGN